MNGTLNKFRKRNIQANLYYFILVIFVIAVSVCLISGLFISHFTLKNSINKFYNNSNLPNLWINIDKIDESDEQFFEDNFKFSKRYVFESDVDINSKNYSAKFIVSGRKISVPYIVDGYFGDGCYVDAKFAESNHIGVGNSYIKFEFELDGDVKEISFPVIGTLAMAEDLLVDGECKVFIDENVFIKTINYYFNSEKNLSAINYNQILVASTVDEGDIELIKSHFNSSSSSVVNIMQKNDIKSFLAVEKELEISRIMLCTFPCLFIILSALVVASTISQMIYMEKYNIGLLKSLGVSNKQIIKNYSNYGVFICLLGAVFGAVISPLIIPNITFENYDKILNLPRSEVSLNFPILQIALILFFSLIIGYLSSIFSSLNLIKMTPKECMSAQPTIKNKSRKKKNRLGVLGQSLKNIKLHCLRSIMSIISVAGCSLLLIFGGSVLNAYKTGKIDGEYSSINIFLSIFKYFSVILMVLIIIILARQIFKERKKEMAVMRIYGKSYFEIWLSFLVEMLVILVIGYVISVLMCYPIMLISLKIMSIGLSIEINFLSFLMSFLVILCAILSVAIGFGVKIVKINLSSEIKFSE